MSAKIRFYKKMKYKMLNAIDRNFFNWGQNSLQDNIMDCKDGGVQGNFSFSY